MSMMRTTALGATFLAGLVSMGCSDSSAKRTDEGAAGKESSITGCLVRGDDGRSFIVRAEDQPQPQGNERPDRPASAASVYRVHAEPRQDLNENVDTRVKLTGYLETVPVHAAGDADGSLKPAPTSGANTKPQDERSDIIDMKVFKVSSLEKLGPCR
jgi:hypothetical protein